MRNFVSSKSLSLATTVVALLLLLAGASPAQDAKKLSPQELAQLVERSDAFFAEVGAGKVPPDNLLLAWVVEHLRLLDIATEIEKMPNSPLHVKIYSRLGVASTMISKGEGSHAAEKFFSRAQKIFDEFEPNIVIPESAEKLATLYKDRAENNMLLGDDKTALHLLDRALRAAQHCSYAGKREEGTIHERLARVHFRAKRWKEALEHAQSAVDIITPATATQPGFDKETLQRALWSIAEAKRQLSEDAEEDFNRFLKFAGEDITAHYRASAFHGAGLNVKDRAPKEAGKARQAALEKAHRYLLNATQIIDTSNKDEDVRKRIAIYADLGDSFSCLDMSVEALAMFRDALDVARKSPSVGKDSPVIIPILERYAELLKSETQQQLQELELLKNETRQQLQELERIKSLPKN